MPQTSDREISNVSRASGMSALNSTPISLSFTSRTVLLSMIG